MWLGTDTQTDTQTAVNTVHFTLATPHAKCNDKILAVPRVCVCVCVCVGVCGLLG